MITRTKDSQSKFWMFTINNPISDIFKNLDGIEYMIYQLEKGNEENTLHYQGYLAFEKIKRFSQVKRLFKNLLNVDIHLEQRKGSHEQAKKYCSKEDTRIKGPFEIGDDKNLLRKKGQNKNIENLNDLKDKLKQLDIREIWETDFKTMVFHNKSLNEYSNIIRKEKVIEELKEEFNNSELKPWQKNVYDLVEDQNKRQVLWIYDNEGNHGKTWLAKYLVVNNNAFYCRGGKIQDVAHAYKGEEIVIFDFTRDSKDYIVYNTIESMKDNMIWSPKYDSHLKLSKCNKVVCFANFLPIVLKMSKDRWLIKEIFNVIIEDKIIDTILVSIDVDSLIEQQNQDDSKTLKN